MSWYPFSTQLSLYRQLPKVDLHRHLEGSLRVDTLMEIARSFGITIPLRPDLLSLVQVQPSDPLTVGNFLAKFQTLRLFYRSPEIIARITREVVLDAAADGVLYLDLHFTPAALSRYQGFSLGDVMDWVAESAARAAADAGITVRLIASVNRHEPVELAEQVVEQAVQRISAGVTGLDLAGNEVQFPAEPFAGLFRQARAAGLALTVHAGEWGGAENVRYALAELSVDRIVHGVRVMEDPSVVALARELGTPFEVCLTSNIQTGVVPGLKQHPLLDMLAAGLNVTLNTDDPGISGITLSDEYRIACEQVGLSFSALDACLQSAARAAFLSDAEKEILVTRLQPALAAFS